jgi:mannose-1-phosphate guanylyltransferase/phosphomannomutase
MEYTVELLKKYGIEQIGVTLQYLPGAIRDYFGDGIDWGVNLHYFLEEVPLGTAGSVKNTGGFLDETFVVVSGDALTDINLRKAVEFHKSKKAIATLVLKRVDVPLDYGVVVTDEEGLITRFLEKPSWGELFSDTANTGIYILEPESLDYFEAGRKFDFSQNLFPILLAEKKPIYGFVTDEYWCDIGNPRAYIQAHYDMLNGLVNIKLPDIEADGNITIEPSARIAKTAVIEGPSYIGDYSRIESGAHIGPFTVIGDHCDVGENSIVERSVLWKNCITGKTASIQGAIICKSVYMQNNVTVGEGAIVGDNCNLSNNCMIKSDVKLWPDKFIEQGALVRSSVIWNSGIKKTLFGSKGITGRVNTELDSQFTARLGAAFGAYLKPGKKVGISCDHNNSAAMLKHGFISGMMSAGLNVFDLKQLNTPILRYAVSHFGFDGGVHIYLDDKSSNACIQIVNELGANLPPSIERQIENLFMQEDFQRSGIDDILRLNVITNTIKLYADMLTTSIDARAVSLEKPKIFLGINAGIVSLITSSVLSKIGCTVNKASRGDLYEELAKDKTYTLGCIVDSNGEELQLFESGGNRVKGETLSALSNLVCLMDGVIGDLVVPYNAPQVIEEMAERFKRKIVRTKTGLHAVMEEMLRLQPNNGHKTAGSVLLRFDAIAFLLKLLEILCKEKKTLRQLINYIPDFHMVEKSINCPWKDKGRVIRSLMEEVSKTGNSIELFEGIKINHEKGWALILPDSDKPLCRVYSDGFSEEYAEELCKFYEGKINRLTGQ